MPTGSPAPRPAALTPVKHAASAVPRERRALDRLRVDPGQCRTGAADGLLATGFPTAACDAVSGGLDTSLGRARLAISGIDQALVLLLAARARLACHAGRMKQRDGLPLGDARREARVRARAEATARRAGLSTTTARAVIALAIADARRVQGLPARPPSPGDTAMPSLEHETAMHHPDSMTATSDVLLRLLPPPARWAPLLRRLPAALQQRLLERAMGAVLAAPIADGSLDFMAGRRLGIEVTDLGLRWVVALCDGKLRADAEAGTAEASVRGTATDLLLLAGRLEDADTLFFQRRLVLTGDTELGLTARNTLERLPWESVPLALRIALNRGARLAQAARAARA